MYASAPYLSGTKVFDVEVTSDLVVAKAIWPNCLLPGSWFGYVQDFEGLSSEELQAKFALPVPPTAVAHVTIKAGAVLRTGVVRGEAFVGARNGAVQLELISGDVCKVGEQTPVAPSQVARPFGIEFANDRTVVLFDTQEVRMGADMSCLAFFEGKQKVAQTGMRFASWEGFQTFSGRYLALSSFVTAPRPEEVTLERNNLHLFDVADWKWASVDLGRCSLTSKPLKDYNLAEDDGRISIDGVMQDVVWVSCRDRPEFSFQA